ncbi:hypothetical protein ABFV99_14220 [Cytobacillus horneckiae]|uniref:hypothetical protein n=1 Tax=Cytobacillus horneckiae TaxID=549687 RepID=UPI0034CD3142
MAVVSKPTQANGSMDYEEMMKTIKYLLDAAWGPKWGSFTQDGPNVTDAKNVEYPVILHYIQEMIPGLIGKGVREIKPRIRYTDINKETNGNQPPATNILGQVFDAEIAFEVWEETNAQVEKVAKRLRQTLSIYAGFLKEKGIKEIIFQKMETNKDSSIRDSSKVRKLIYLVRFEELTEVPTDVLRVVDIVEKKLQKETNKTGE